MKVWKWYTSNEVNQHSFSVCTAKSHSGLTRWQRLESKANTALVLIKGLLLPLTGFNEELEVKDKQTNSDFASCSCPALVPDAALIKDPRSKRWGLSSLFFTGHIAACACSVLALICSLFFFPFFSYNVFCVWLANLLAVAHRTAGSLCSLPLRCFAGSLAAEQDRGTRTELYTKTHTCRRRTSTGGSTMPSAHDAFQQMIKASSDRETCI